ncbi:hypothetical protein CDAR_577401 [Caerostris darwini]|uniref:Uncharacterized protein n=1 Tax=Caerostris darwini TaxID=1538125 RepID=A0AAV4U3L9_9ARAC|nr:hypothetical protein CDAR_577401 [Caerostris darwini]
MPPKPYNVSHYLLLHEDNSNQPLVLQRQLQAYLKRKILPCHVTKWIRKGMEVTLHRDTSFPTPVMCHPVQNFDPLFHASKNYNVSHYLLLHEDNSNQPLVLPIQRQAYLKKKISPLSCREMDSKGYGSDTAPSTGACHQCHQSTRFSTPVMCHPVRVSLQRRHSLLEGMRYGQGVYSSC